MALEGRAYAYLTFTAAGVSIGSVMAARFLEGEVGAVSVTEDALECESGRGEDKTYAKYFRGVGT